MGDTSIDGDHEIEAADQRGGFVEIGKLVCDVENVQSAKDFLVGSPRILLQTDKLRIDIQNARQHTQRQRPVSVVGMTRITGPYQSNAKSVV